MNIHIKSYGQGRPLVFFHGWGFNHQVWLPLIPFLHHHYELILVDLPGFGLSPMMDWQDFKKNLLPLLPPHFVLTGWSMGGLYATRLALEAPERVSFLFNIASSPRFIKDTLWPGVAPEVLLQFHKNILVDSTKALNEFIALQSNHQDLSMISGTAPTLEGLESGLAILGGWDLREQIKGLIPSVCFMFGRLDPITPVTSMATMQVLYPDFKYILFNKSAHMPFLSHTESFITEFLGVIR